MRVSMMMLLWLAAAAIVTYWISYFSDGAVQASGQTCYHVFERSFPLPDGFIAMCAVLAAVALRRQQPSAVLWGLLTAGGFFFLGLIDISYNLWNQMYAQHSVAMAIEAIINVCSLSLASGLSLFFWVYRRALGA